MLVSCTTIGLAHRLGGEDAAIRLLASVGFDAYDMGFCGMTDEGHWMHRDDWREEILRLRRVADEAGIVCNQAHAPFDGPYEKIRDWVIRSMEAAALLGARIIVVHPRQHLTYAENVERLREINREYYTSLLPYCEQFGIAIATENMWHWNSFGKHIIDSTCSRAPEFCEYIDMIDSPYLVGCLDIGHTSLVGVKLGDFIRTMGKARLRALHVHDNDYQQDSHTLPYLLNIDFSEMTRALREIGYEGDMTFEAHSFFTRFPDALLPAAARLMCEVGKYLVKECTKS